MAKTTHQMDPNKSGVLIYFEPMRDEANNLDDARLGKLFRAILNFAATGAEPEFDDETLTHVWRFVRTLVIRDDKTYRNKSANKKYAVYCRFAKENNHKPLSREEWDALGGPTFTEWKNMQAHTGACTCIQPHTDACTCMPTTTATTTAVSNSSSLSSTVSATARGGGAPSGVGSGWNAADKLRELHGKFQREDGR